MTPLIPPTHASVQGPQSAWYDSGANLLGLTETLPAGTWERLRRVDLSRWIPAMTALLVLLGILFRLRFYLFNRSLWFDEALLTVNIISRPFDALVPPLEFHQGAPFGFLALEKAAIAVFGTSEFALRAVPLFASIAALLLLYSLCRRILSVPATLVTVGLFALSTQQIGYSAEVKPYSMDTVVGLLVTLMAIRAAETLRRRHLAVLALTGAVVVWFSYPAAFVLAGIGICLAASPLRHRDWVRVAQLAAIGLLWAISFAICYSITVRPIARDTFVSDMWASAFMPWSVSYWTLDWVLGQSLGFFKDPVGMTLSGLGVFGFLAGWAANDRSWRLQRWILASPLAVAFVAAAVHRYPFDGRFLNFAVPSILCIVGLGIARVAEMSRLKAPAIALSLVALVFLDPVRDASFLALRPQGREEIRPVLDYVRQHVVRGDAVYLYYRTEPAFTYYSQQWTDGAGLQTAKIVHTHPGGDLHGQDELDALEMMNSNDRSAAFLRALDELRGQTRVWVVFYHVRVRDGVNDERWLLDQLDRLGKQRDRVSSPGASAYLYDLQPNPALQTG